jgi:GNAT superfamily N-acetyltransferase
LFVAELDGHLYGFVQAYLLHTSTHLAPILIVNDLFVDASARSKGFGGSLLRAVERHARRAGAVYLELSVRRKNPARRLYERLGWDRDRESVYYNLRLRPGLRIA